MAYCPEEGLNKNSVVVPGLTWHVSCPKCHVDITCHGDVPITNFCGNCGAPIKALLQTAKAEKEGHKRSCNKVWWGIPEFYGSHSRGCNCPECCNKERSPICDCGLEPAIEIVLSVKHCDLLLDLMRPSKDPACDTIRLLIERAKEKKSEEEE